MRRRLRRLVVFSLVFSVVVVELDDTDPVVSVLLLIEPVVSVVVVVVVLRFVEGVVPVVLWFMLAIEPVSVVAVVPVVVCCTAVEVVGSLAGAL